MKRTKKLLVYEHVSAGGMTGCDPAALDLLPSGLAMRDALVRDLLELEDYDVSVATFAASSPVPPTATPLTSRSGESAFSFVARQAALHDLVWVVAPETGGLLARLCQLVGAPRWLGCDAGAITLAASKSGTLIRLAADGVTTPLAFEGDSRVTRWVVKPDDGAGAVATRVHCDREAAWNAGSDCKSPDGGAMTVEPWVEGEPLSLSLLCGTAGTEVLSVNRQHVRVDAAGSLAFEGVSANAVPRADPRRAVLSGWASRVTGCIPGLHGFVGIDLVWHAQRGPVLIEVNPRLTCAYVGLSAALGRNLAAEAIAACNPEAALANA